MAILIAGLIMFLGPHSIRIVADQWREAHIARLGKMRWKLGYSLISAIGLGLIVWGFRSAREQPIFLWTPPVGIVHLTALLTFFAFILIAAAYVPHNHIKAAIHHPMVVGVQAWAAGHLLANGTLADVILFGSFFIWASLNLKAARLRDRRRGISHGRGSIAGTAISVASGALIWSAFVFRLHAMLIGTPLSL